MPKFEDDLRAVISADISDFKKGMNTAKVLARDTGKAIDTVRLSELSKDLADLQIKKKELNTDFKKNQALYDKGLIDRKKLIKSKEALNSVSSSVTETGRKLQNLKNTGDENLSRLQKKFNEVGKGTNFLKTQLLKLGPIIATAFGARAIALFVNQLDNARSEIIKATGASGKALKELTDIAENVFKTVPESIDLVGKAVGEISTRFGSTGEELRFLTKDFLDFARITGQDVQTSVRDVSRFMADMGIEASQTSTVLDKLTVASQVSGVSISRLTNTSVQYGVQLRALGFDLDTSIALLSKFEKEGVSTEKIFSGLSQALGKLAKEGIDDPAQGFAELTKRIEEAGSVGEATRIAIELLGTRAGPDFALAVREGRFEIEEYTKALSDTEGALSDTAKASLTTAQRAKIVGNQFKSELIPILESLLPVLQKIVDFTPKIVGGFKILYTSIVGYFVNLGLQAGVLVNNLRNNFQNAGLIVQSFAKAVGSIFGNIVDNIAIAFGNIGPLIGKGLNKALGPINGFFNSFTNTYNKTLGKLFGTIGGKSNLSIDFGDTKQLKSITDGVGEIFAEVESKIGENNANIERKNAILEEAIRSNREDTKNKLLDIVDEEAEYQKKRDNERVENFNNAVDDALGLADEESEGRVGAAQKASDEIEKIKEQEEEMEKRRNEASLDRIDRLEDAQEKYTETFEESMKKSEENAEGLRKKIEEVEGQIESLNDLEKDKGEKLGERALEIEKEISELKEERRDADSVERRALNQKIKALREEQQLIQANTTQAQRDEAQRVAGLSKTEKLLESFAEKEQGITGGKTKEKLQSELLNLQESLTQEQQAYQNLADAKVQIEEYYADKIKSIQEGITSKQVIEDQKRIASLKKVEQQAIDTANALARAGMGGSSSRQETNNTSVNVNANISNEMDLNKVSRYIADEVTLSNKGIK